MMKNILSILVVLLALSACEGRTRITIPWTVQEHTFYKKLEQEKHPVIDSISREIIKKKYGDYSYEYNIDIYVAEEHILRDSIILKKQAHEIVSFIAKKMVLGSMKIKSVSISYRYRNGDLGYAATIDENQNYAFKLEPYISK